MGYSVLRFVRPVDQHLRCPICSSALESPVLTPCGHTFCRTCLITWLVESAQADLQPRSLARSHSAYNSASLRYTDRPSSVTQGHIHSADSQAHGDTELAPSRSAQQHPHSVSIAHHSFSRSQSSSELDQERRFELSGTCPECRSSVLLTELSPIICLRNLILALEVTCVYSDRGCPTSFPLEQSERHLQTCGFIPVTCFGCQTEVNRSEMTSHQATCPAIRKILHAEQEVKPETESFDRSIGNDGDNTESSTWQRLDTHRGGRQELPDDDHHRENSETRPPAAAGERSARDRLSIRRGRCLTPTSYAFTCRHGNSSSNINVSSASVNPSSRASSNRIDASTGTLKNCTILVDTTGLHRETLSRSCHDEPEAGTYSANSTVVITSHNSMNNTNSYTAVRSSSPMARGQMMAQPVSQASLAMAQASCAAQVSRLLTRIGALETQVGKLLDDLHEANSKNSLLNTEYRRIQKELLICRRDKAVQTTSQTGCPDEVDDVSTNSSYHNIGQLSVTIAQNLLAKPSYIDSFVVFRQLRSCYVDNFLSSSILERKRNAVHDLHVLLATAYASNWFTPDQRASLGLWLQHVLLTSGNTSNTNTHSSGDDNTNTGDNTSSTTRSIIPRACTTRRFIN